MRTAAAKRIMEWYGKEMRNGRAYGWRVILDQMARMQSPRVVETGTTRALNQWSDGMATVIFGHYLSLAGGRLDTVDISQAALLVSQMATAKWQDKITRHSSDSVAFLRARREPIDVLFLDSFDYHKGVERASMAHNLAEAKAALPRMAANAIIAIDDCMPTGGKGTLTVPWLRSQGWSVIHNGYITVLTKITNDSDAGAKADALKTYRQFLCAGREGVRAACPEASVIEGKVICRVSGETNPAFSREHCPSYKW